VRALLLAAGLGTRLAPITHTVPKCLVEIEGRPLLDYWLELLTTGGIRDILVNLHYLPDVVRHYIAGSPYAGHVKTVYEDRLLGTGGTLLNNKTFFAHEPAMVIHADNLSLFDLRAFVARFESRAPGIEITMMTFRTDVPETCGIVELDRDGVVQAFHEKVKNPPGNLANAAVYILAPSVLAFIESLGKDVVDLSTEVLPRYLGRINTFENDVYHRDIGNVQSLTAARQEYPSVAARAKELLR
jgi:mannose-1-phosphate guanylyltransferase